MNGQLKFKMSRLPGGKQEGPKPGQCPCECGARIGGEKRWDELEDLTKTLS